VLVLTREGIAQAVLAFLIELAPDLEDVELR
jgi:hypothetical protein